MQTSSTRMGGSSDTRAAPASAPPPPPPQRPLHATDADEEDESVKQLNECAALYLSLQDCLVESNRNWKACQAHVQALKACQAKRNKSDKI